MNNKKFYMGSFKRPVFLFVKAIKVLNVGAWGAVIVL